MASVENGIAGSQLPSSLIDLSSLYLKSRSIHAQRDVSSISWSDITHGLAIPLAPDRREFIDYSGSAFYSPIPYLPQAISISAGRACGLAPLALLYLGRLTNALVAVLLLSMAVRITPVCKPGFLLAAMLPMSVYLYASLSADALILASSFLFTALALDACWKKAWATKRLWLALGCAVVFCSVKVVYAPLLLIAAPVALTAARRSRAVLIQVLLIIVPLVITFAWLYAASNLVVAVRPGTGVGAQLQHVLAHPILFAKALVHGFVWNGFYYRMLVGMFGWLTVPLPTIGYVLPLIGLIMAGTSFSTQRPPWFSSIWWATIVAGCITLVMLALYLYWTVIGNEVVEGVQGRYFIPILPLAAVATSSGLHACGIRVPGAYALAAVAVLACIEAGISYSTLLHAFW